MIPDYLNDQTEDVIMQRIMARIPDDLDKSEGGYLWDAIAPTVQEFAQIALWAGEVLRRVFASTTFGAYLDAKCGENGVFRNPAVASVGQVKFTGTVGTVVVAGTQVVVPADPMSGSAAIEYVTISDVTVGGTGFVYADIVASVAGASGNVPASAIKLLFKPITGITGVINTAATTGGLDIESDQSLYSRFQQTVQAPSAGGNKADYVTWALAVAGVGGVSVIPVENGPGTVSVYVIDTTKAPANQTIVDAVQNAIAPPRTLTHLSAALVNSGSGMSTDVDGVKMVYNAGGTGTSKDLTINTGLVKPGIWTARPKIKVSDVSGSNNLLDIGVWNLSTGAWAKQSPSSALDAKITYKANQLTPTFDTNGSYHVVVPFYWNGADQLELRVTRLQTDTTTTAWINSVDYISAFSDESGAGKAPIGATISVMAGVRVTITVSATITVIPGYNVASVQAAVQAAIASYITSLAFTSSNDILWSRVSQAIGGVTGVADYSSVLVNGGTTNVVIADREVAVLGTVTLS